MACSVMVQKPVQLQVAVLLAVPLAPGARPTATKVPTGVENAQQMPTVRAERRIVEVSRACNVSSARSTHTANSTSFATRLVRVERFLEIKRHASLHQRSMGDGPRDDKGASTSRRWSALKLPPRRREKRNAFEASPRRRSSCLAGALGFEPRFSVPKTDVLPLDDAPTG